MKKTVYFTLIFFAIFSFIGCASTAVENASATKATNKENLQIEKKLRFDNWKYKGFGNEIPLWVEPAVDENIEYIKKLDDVLASAEIKIIKGTGENTDQAEQSGKELAGEFQNENPGYQLYEKFWVKEIIDDDISENNLKEMPYISVYVFYKE